MRFFCTYFDSAYLPRGIALYESLQRHCSSFTLWVLCLDEEVEARLAGLNLPGVVLVNTTILEENIIGLGAARQNRSKAEYYFTCSPALPLYLLTSNRMIDVLTYLDSDLFFYSTPEPIFRELGSASIGIIAHRPTPGVLAVDRYGVFNVGWISFRNDDIGLACLRWWCQQCLEWCYLKVEGGRYADQKYLDEFPTRFGRVVIIEHPGANLAPWNIERYSITKRHGKITVNGKPLIFFHFQGLLEITRRCYGTGFRDYRVRISRAAVRWIFQPYIRMLREHAPRGIGAGLVYTRRKGFGAIWKRVLRPVLQLARAERILWLFGRVW